MKEKYITDDEREKCRKVADAFAELYENENILVVDAGRYGFVKLGQFTRNYTQTTKRGLLTTNKG